MDFALSANQESIRDAVAKICARFDDAYWLKKDKEGGFPSDLHKALADAGWLGICIPEEYGGSGLGILDDEHLVATGFFPVVQHPTEGPIRSTKVSADWSDTKAEPTRLAPRLNEHGAEILREAGFSREEIENMIRDGVTKPSPVA